jgi:hypothetical protein
VDSPDNVDWTDASALGANTYLDGLVFVNEDNSSGEIWQMDPDGANPIKVASTTVGAESTGILDISEMVGYLPGSILITNNQGSPASLSVLINPDATSDTPINVPGMQWMGRALIALSLIATSGLALTTRQLREHQRRLPLPAR